jgi:hypothetical protein
MQIINMKMNNVELLLHCINSFEHENVMRKLINTRGVET